MSKKLGPALQLGESLVWKEQQSKRQETTSSAAPVPQKTKPQPSQPTQPKVEESDQSSSFLAQPSRVNKQPLQPLQEPQSHFPKVLPDLGPSRANPMLKPLGLPGGSAMKPKSTSELLDPPPPAYDDIAGPASGTQFGGKPAVERHDTEYTIASLPSGEMPPPERDDLYKELERAPSPPDNDPAVETDRTDQKEAEAETGW